MQRKPDNSFCEKCSVLLLFHRVNAQRLVFAHKTTDIVANFTTFIQQCYNVNQLYVIAGQLSISQGGHSDQRLFNSQCSEQPLGFIFSNMSRSLIVANVMEIVFT